MESLGERGIPHTKDTYGKVYSTISPLFFPTRMCLILKKVYISFFSSIGGWLQAGEFAH